MIQIVLLFGILLKEESGAEAIVGGIITVAFIFLISAIMRAVGNATAKKKEAKKINQ
jgi:hypothetical protein